MLSEKDSSPESSGKVAVTVIGARGYSGLELCRLLMRHSQVQLKAVFAQNEFQLSQFLPERSARSVKSFPLKDLNKIVESESLQIAFLATPVEASVELAQALLDQGVHVIDLSGAFRLAQSSDEGVIDTYKKWYGFMHTHPELLKIAEFGLHPWIAKSADSQKPARARLISNPGCFSTAVLTALLPLLRSNLIDAQSLVIDAKSGTTGAGKRAEERLLHSEVDGLCLPYRVGRHQHEPEIRLYAQKWGGAEITPFFTTHLLNVRRGIVASLYARVKPDVTGSKVYEAYSQFYADDKLIEFGDLDHGAEPLLNLRRVVGSARTQIAFKVVDDRLYVFSLIDNLLKGAASQAVENMNRLLGLATWTGLTELEGVI
jgi:N-acetyl-gamma-glutamyl-phosphate reductase